MSPAVQHINTSAFCTFHLRCSRHCKLTSKKEINEKIGIESD